MFYSFKRFFYDCKTRVYIFEMSENCRESNKSESRTLVIAQSLSYFSHCSKYLQFIFDYIYQKEIPLGNITF